MFSLTVFTENVRNYKKLHKKRFGPFVLLFFLNFILNYNNDKITFKFNDIDIYIKIQ